MQESQQNIQPKFRIPTPDRVHLQKSMVQLSNKTPPVSPRKKSGCSEYVQFNQLRKSQASQENSYVNNP